MNNVRGILLIILAMAGFSIEDMFIKKLSAPLPTGQILIVLGLGSSLIFLVLAKLNGDRLLAPAAWGRLPMWRAFFEAIAAAAFAGSLALVELSTVAAVFQALPLAITMGAALFLGEQVGWRRWSAISLGFVGVLLIIRPGFDGFDPASLLVLIAVVTVAARDLITRRIDSAVSSYVVSFQGFASLIVAGGCMLAFTTKPIGIIGSFEAWMFAGAILFGAAGYWGIVTAMRVGEASVVAPYRYTRLLFSLVIGILVFKEEPDTLTILGASLIIGTGLYTFLRERRLDKPVEPPHSDFPAD
ncbi:Permease of the drug/metabolite transporter (DMT) superfamily [Shimia gijangensis]|uniref:Permease of the drug/metabolite transporter (DMT) superfamily n=1 Tax=Shimia gijangensis TaxID=1470563 RepID=A0A1M6HXJ6_9RHOB|nr:DMT family transporter [Shimia gijangensis]SHJ26921.1 Permease of the drug/metabolite transporter (DMT) superfamily [Shimia gijangensis]